MAEELPKEQEPSTPVSGPVVVEQPKHGFRSFSRARRELNPDEVASPQMQPVFLDLIEQLKEEKAEVAREADRWQEKFHQVDKECSVFKAENKTKWLTDLSSAAGMTLGGVLLAWAESFRVSDKARFYELIIVGGLVLLIGLSGFVIKAIKR